MKENLTRMNNKKATLLKVAITNKTYLNKLFVFVFFCSFLYFHRT